MRRILTSIFLFLIVASISVQAQRSDQPERRAEMKERFEKRAGEKSRMQRGPEAMLGKLNLTENQKDQIQKIMLDGKKEITPLENQLGEKKARLRTLSSGDKYDVKALNSVVDEMATLHAEVQKVHIAKKGEIREILNEDQKVIFDSMPEKRERLKKHRTFKARR